MLARSLDSHRQLGRQKDKEWLNSSLAFLKAWAVVGGSGGPQALALPLGAEVASADDRKGYMENLVKDIIDNARSLGERKPVIYPVSGSILSLSSARVRGPPNLLYTHHRGRIVLRRARWVILGSSRSEPPTLCTCDASFLLGCADFKTPVDGSSRCCHGSGLWH